MSEIEKRFISTQQQELEYQKRKNSELLSYAEKNHKLIEELLARAKKAEAALESAQKMCDHWEAKAAERQQQVNERQAKADQLFDQKERVRGALNAADVETLHFADECGERKPMTLAERVQWLVKSRDDWKRIARDNEARAVKTETERDEWKRRAGNAEFEVKRQRDLVNPVDWERVRIEAAIAVMQGMWASQCDNFGRPMPVFAVDCADDLVAELQKREVQG